MTQNRKDELYDQMIAWICEHHENDEALFLVLTEHFGMTKEELHDHSIESLDRFFTDGEVDEESEAETVSETVRPVGISVSDFISEVSGMVSIDDKTAVLDWIEFASFMTDVDESGRRTLESELQELYLPLCYVRNNFSNVVLQNSLNLDTIGNEVIYGAMLFAAGYPDNVVRDMGNEGTLEEGYISLSADEKGSLFVVAVAGRKDCIFIGNNMEGGVDGTMDLLSLMGCNLYDVHFDLEADGYDAPTVSELRKDTLTEKGKKEWSDVLGTTVESIRYGNGCLICKLTDCDPERLCAFTEMLNGQCDAEDYERWVKSFGITYPQTEDHSPTLSM